MNLGDLTNLLEKPLAAVPNIINTPNSAGRYRPFYLRNLLDAVQGRTLEEAVDAKTVLIIGASSGIGEAAAKKIAEAGGVVALVARTRENLEKVASEIRENGGSAHVYPCDLSDMDAIAAMADRVLDDLGGVDILINNAGRSIRRSLELSYDRIHDYQRTMQLNYLGAVQLILKFIPGMRERGFGQIINVSSVGVQTRAPRFGAYIASKAALDSLCGALQAEVVNDNVKFTTVHMALVRTPMISPTTLYDKFPALTPEQAAGVIADAIVHRPRRASSPFGQFAAVADAVNPAVMDRVRNRAFAMFGDSSAAKGDESATDTTEFDARSETFVRATRGIHWWDDEPSQTRHRDHRRHHRRLVRHQRRTGARPGPPRLPAAAGRPAPRAARRSRQ
ncbi:oxidoreductase [Mycobacterium lepraemurium]|nr:oxidoreductase [Mycobacterium lepraemurium]